ncbi:unnamed protein product [Cylicocyclus nassatus]|uniref:C-type lectin domain-containing protein n=1 Tax=Cylicocyclus nassatus TaxID=53992 RepID=A0AA36H045_CYLNA|nr:unnamed protein product [Cylicocyclus nassatus]
MHVMKFLLYILIPLSEAFISLTKHFSRGLHQTRSLARFNESNAGPGHCESKWTYFNETNACYKNFFWSTFNAAESLCKTVGGHLTSIHSFEENSFVAEMSKSGNRLTDSAQATWIGLVRSDYLNSNWNSSLTVKWVWTDGTKVDFLAWAPNKPNAKGSERCALLYSDPHANSAYALWYEKWNGFTCIPNLRSFVCKKMALH